MPPSQEAECRKSHRQKGKEKGSLAVKPGYGREAGKELRAQRLFSSQI